MLSDEYAKLIAIGYDAGQERRGKIITCTLAPVLPSALTPLVIGYLDVDPNIIRALHSRCVYLRRHPPAYSIGRWKVEVTRLDDSDDPCAMEIRSVEDGEVAYSTTADMLELVKILIGEGQEDQTMDELVFHLNTDSADDAKLAAALLAGLWADIMSITTMAIAEYGWSEL
jgi:hypothetical protein